MNKFKSMAIEGYVKNKYPQYFQNGAFSVDLNAENASCRVTATLEGESAQITVNIGKYAISTKGDKKILEITDISCDRQWIDALLRDRLLGAKIPVPSIVASVLEA